MVNWKYFHAPLIRVMHCCTHAVHIKEHTKTVNIWLQDYDGTKWEIFVRTVDGFL